MEEDKEYQGVKNVEKLEQYLFDLKQIKNQVDDKVMPKQLAERLLLMVRTIWGAVNIRTQTYTEKINAIRKTHPMMIATDFSGREKKVTFDINRLYSKLIDEIIADIEPSIRLLQETKKKDDIVSRLLSRERRIFFDVRKPENNVRLIDLIENERERAIFAKELENILANYPMCIGQDEVCIKEILKHFANICGVSTQTQPGWFYCITGEDGTLWSLTLRTDNDKWYNFMASDDFISVEQCKPKEKHIIGLYGSAGKGKTPTMHKVFRLLQEKYPKHSVVFESDDRYDVKGLFFIGNAKVGIEGQGDPNSRQQNSIAEFVSIGCDIIIISSRIFGMTVDAIDRFGYMYEINWAEREVESNENLHEAINQAQAKDLVQQAEQFAAKIN